MARRDPKRRRKPGYGADGKPLESKIQGDIAKRFAERLQMCVIAAVPNETRQAGFCAVNEMNAKKGRGMCVGFPDLTVWWRGVVVLIEVKRPGGSLQDNQREVHAKLEGNGFPVFVIKSVEEADEIIDGMLERTDLEPAMPVPDLPPDFPF